MTARRSDRDVRPPPSSGLFECSIYPVEHPAGDLEIGSADLGAQRIGPRMLNRLDLVQGAPPARRQAHELGAAMAGFVVVRGHPPLRERVDDALHALSREPLGGPILDR
jgi:hypothetical protein